MEDGVTIAGDQGKRSCLAKANSYVSAAAKVLHRREQERQTPRESQSCTGWTAGWLDGLGGGIRALVSSRWAVFTVSQRGREWGKGNPSFTEEEQMTLLAPQNLHCWRKQTCIFPLKKLFKYLKNLEVLPSSLRLTLPRSCAVVSEFLLQVGFLICTEGGRGNHDAPTRRLRKDGMICAS